MAGINGKLPFYKNVNKDIDFGNITEQGVYLINNSADFKTLNSPSGAQNSILILLGISGAGNAAIQLCFPAGGNNSYWRIDYGAWLPWRTL